MWNASFRKPSTEPPFSSNAPHSSFPAPVLRGPGVGVPSCTPPLPPPPSPIAQTAAMQWLQGVPCLPTSVAGPLYVRVGLNPPFPLPAPRCNRENAAPSAHPALSSCLPVCPRTSICLQCGVNPRRKVRKGGKKVRKGRKRGEREREGGGGRKKGCSGK